MEDFIWKDLDFGQKYQLSFLYLIIGYWIFAYKLLDCAILFQIGIFDLGSVLEFRTETQENWFIRKESSKWPIHAIATTKILRKMDWSQYLRQILRDIQNRVYLPQLK